MKENIDTPKNEKLEKKEIVTTDIEEQNPTINLPNKEKPFLNFFNISYALFILIILIPYVLFFYDLFFVNKNPKLILSFYKIFISWPIIIFIISLILIKKFHPEITNLINRIKSANWKTGDIEMEKLQSNKKQMNLKVL